MDRKRWKWSETNRTECKSTRGEGEMKSLHYKLDDYGHLIMNDAMICCLEMYGLTRVNNEAVNSNEA